MFYFLFFFAACRPVTVRTILKTEKGDCESDGDVAFTYCDGGCGLLPVLNLDENGLVQKSTCQCCTGMRNNVFCP